MASPPSLVRLSSSYAALPRSATPSPPLRAFGEPPAPPAPHAKWQTAEWLTHLVPGVGFLLWAIVGAWVREARSPRVDSALTTGLVATGLMFLVSAHYHLSIERPCWAAALQLADYTGVALGMAAVVAVDFVLAGETRAAPFVDLLGAALALGAQFCVWRALTPVLESWRVWRVWRGYAVKASVPAALTSETDGADKHSNPEASTLLQQPKNTNAENRPSGQQEVTSFWRVHKLGRDDVRALGMSLIAVLHVSYAAVLAERLGWPYVGVVIGAYCVVGGAAAIEFAFGGRDSERSWLHTLWHLATAAAAVALAAARETIA